MERSKRINRLSETRSRIVAPYRLESVRPLTQLPWYFDNYLSRTDQGNISQRMYGRSHSSRSALLIAFGASFAVYLIPLFGPHASWSLGQYLYQWQMPAAPHQDISWIAMDWGVALALQVLAGMLCYWVLVRPGWIRILAVAACAPVFVAAANRIYLSALPSRFLTERATTSDQGDWKTVCTVPDMEVAEVRSPPDTSLARSGQAWMRANDEYAVLTMPGCHTRLITKPDASTQLDLSFVSPAGVYLMRNWDNQTRQTHWWVGDGSLRLLSRLPEDSILFGMPVLSNDGHWVAWMEVIPGTKLHRAVVQSLNDERAHFVDIPDQRLLQWTLLGADMDRNELTFYAYDYTTQRSSLTMLGLGSGQQGDSIVAQGVAAQFTTLLRVGSGWVAWDAARDLGERYRIAWSLANGRGVHEALRGRGITAVKVDPDGAYVAISESNAIRDNIVKDAVYVLRTSDGKEVWHRNLPSYTRSSLAFLGGKLFAYTDSDGAHPTVRVLQIPD